MPVSHTGRIHWSEDPEPERPPFEIPEPVWDQLWKRGFWQEFNVANGTIFDEYEGDTIPPAIAERLAEHCRATATTSDDEALRTTLGGLADYLEEGARNEQVLWADF